MTDGIEVLVCSLLEDCNPPNTTKQILIDNILDFLYFLSKLSVNVYKDQPTDGRRGSAKFVYIMSVDFL